MRIAVAIGADFSAAELINSFKTIFSGASVAVFNNIADAVEFSNFKKPDIVFIDNNLCRENTQQIARDFKLCNKSVNIIYMNGMDDVLDIADGQWILQPVRKVKKEDSNKNKVLVYAQCFGNFDVFKTDRTRLNFKLKKAKELFAYLIYRFGAACTNAEAAGVLFEDDNYDRTRQRHLQKIIHSLIETFEEANVADVIIRARGSMSVDVSKVQCDYYDFMKHDANALRTWSGEFMTQYSWAETVTGYISHFFEEKD